MAAGCHRPPTDPPPPPLSHAWHPLPPTHPARPLCPPPHRSPTPPARRPPWLPPATSCASSAASSAAPGGTTSARGRPARWVHIGHAVPVVPADVPADVPCAAGPAAVLLGMLLCGCLPAFHGSKPATGSCPLPDPALTPPPALLLPCPALQDVACAECPLHGSEEALGGNPAALFCVFDGHCGRGAADAASVALPDAVSTRLKGAPAVPRFDFLAAQLTGWQSVNQSFSCSAVSALPLSSPPSSSLTQPAPLASPLPA